RQVAAQLLSLLSHPAGHGGRPASLCPSDQLHANTVPFYAVLKRITKVRLTAGRRVRGGLSLETCPGPKGPAASSGKLIGMPAVAGSRPNCQHTLTSRGLVKTGLPLALTLQSAEIGAIGTAR